MCQGLFYALKAQWENVDLWYLCIRGMRTDKQLNKYTAE